MPTAYIQRPGAKVSLESAHLDVRLPAGLEQEAETRVLPLRDLDRVILSNRVNISTAALSALVEHGIPVVLMTGNGRMMGAFLPPMRDHAAFRLAQYQCTQEPEFALLLAGRIIAAKIYNQRRALQRLAANRREAMAAEPGSEELQASVGRALAQMERLLADAPRCENMEQLRGVEGAAAAQYFAAWARFFPLGQPFPGRSTRPPLNPPNACLSFISTMLYHEMVAFLHAHGLDPGLGLLHTTENGRWSLALDLMEPFRPVVAEALTLDLFSRRMLEASHFGPKKGGVYLNAGGRPKLILQYEKRMDRQFMSESAGHRTTLRQQLERQASMFKAALEDVDRFEPFLMN